jgi:hypothetical protein
MRIAALLAWLGLLAFLLLTLPLLPAQIGDLGKELPRFVYVLVLMTPASVLPLVGRLILPGIAREKPHLVNLPHRDYWLAEPRREATIARLLDHLAGLELQIVLLLTGMHGFIVLKARGTSLPLWAWLCFGTLWLAWVVRGMLRVQRDFALPKA